MIRRPTRSTRTYTLFPCPPRVRAIGADFVEKFDAARERCWIAEKDGAVVGSAFVVRHSDAVAKLRMVYVEPTARGHGIGLPLVAEAIALARGPGYGDRMRVLARTVWRIVVR